VKDCTNCIYADWRRTASGRLHPSGDGKCGKVITIPQIPPCYYWFDKPRLAGGYINRRKELSEHCPFYQRIARFSELLRGSP
jgi:hypothetical protein